MQEKLLVSSDANTILPSRPSPTVGLKSSSMLENAAAQQAKVNEVATSKVGERPHAAKETRPSLNDSTVNNNSSAPAPK